MFWLFWLVLMPLVFWLPAIVGLGGYVLGRVATKNKKLLDRFVFCGAMAGLASTVLLMSIDFSPWGISTHLTGTTERVLGFFLGIIQLAGYGISVLVLVTSFMRGFLDKTH